MYTDESDAMFDKAIASAIVRVTCLSCVDHTPSIHVSSAITMTDELNCVR